MRAIIGSHRQDFRRAGCETTVAQLLRAKTIDVQGEING